jgi:hypothetical protein
MKFLLNSLAATLKAPWFFGFQAPKAPPKKRMKKLHPASTRSLKKIGPSKLKKHSKIKREARKSAK